MPSFATAKASTFPALYQAMHVHKQQRLPVQTVFVYYLNCSAYHSLEIFSTDDIMQDRRAAWLTQVLFLSQW